MTATTSSTVLSPARLAEFRAVLLRHRADCLTDLQEAAEATAENGPDPVLDARSTALRETLADVDAALARMDAGTYGACVHCGAAIPDGRLELRPFAAACVPCLEKR